MKFLFLLSAFIFSSFAFATPDHNLGDHLQVLDLIPSASIVATGNGTGVDLIQFDNQLAIVLDCGAATAGSSPTMDIKIQDSADNSSFTDLSPAFAFTQVTNAASVQKKVLNKSSAVVRRYIRAVKTIGGTSSPAFPCSVKGYGVYKNPA